MATYLQKRRHRWYAVLEIPAAVRHHFGGKARFVKSLQTDSHEVAGRRMHSVIAAWKNDIALAIGEPVDDEAAIFRRRLRNAKTEEERQSILEQISSAADDIAYENIDFGEKLSSVPEAQRFYSMARGNLVPFTEHLDEWLKSSQAIPKTKDMHRSDINRFAVKFKMVQDVDRADVRRWITDIMNGDANLSPKTVQRILSALRGYWRYLQSINVANEEHEPFSKLNVARQNQRKSPRSVRQPFEPEDVLKLLDAAIKHNDDKLADLIRLGMWTGCRIEELCALKVEQVKENYFSIEGAKTAAGWRDVPIHPNLAETMVRLIEKSKDDYVLSGLTENKYGDRSNAIGKRFGRLKKELEYGPEHVFHSIRKTVITILENKGVPENIVADIVGHEKTTMTYGLYSGGLSLEVKRKALAKLAY